MTAVPAPLVRTIDMVRVVAYAGATWDWHRLHHDQTEIRARGLPGPVVDGQMFGALLAEQALDWAGPDARVVQMEFRFSAMVHAGETVTVTAEIMDESGPEVTLRQRITAVDTADPEAAEKVAVDGARTVLALASSVEWKQGGS